MPDVGELVLEAESPFVVWQNQVIQLADAPFHLDGVLQVPIQLLVDFLPAYLPRRFAFDHEIQRLTVIGSDGVDYTTDPDGALGQRPTGPAPDPESPPRGQPAEPNPRRDHRPRPRRQRSWDSRARRDARKDHRAGPRFGPGRGPER